MSKRSVALALLLVLASSGAEAFDVYPSPPSAAGKSQHVIVDSSYDVNTLRSQSLDFNALFAPFGDAYESGFRFRVTESASWYRFINGTDPLTYGFGRSNAVEFLPGYFLALPRISILALAGVSVIDSVDDGIATHRRAGKAVLSFFAQPTDQTMAYGNYNYLTLRNAYQLQNKVGVKVAGKFYLGPEATFSGADGSSAQKFGAHLSGLSLGKVIFSISAGHIHDRQLGGGAYISTNLYGAF